MLTGKVEPNLSRTTLPKMNHAEKALLTIAPSQVSDTCEVALAKSVTHL